MRAAASAPRPSDCCWRCESQAAAGADPEEAAASTCERPCSSAAALLRSMRSIWMLISSAGRMMLCFCRYMLCEWRIDYWH